MIFIMTNFILFIDYFRHVQDTSVSLRYNVGAVQLQTLNTASFFRKGRMYYRIHRNRYNAYFNRYYGPTLFIFATFSVALSAMQVAMAVRQAEAPIELAKDLPEAGHGGGLGGSWRHMGYAFQWFSLWAICFAAAMAAILFCMFVGLASLDGLDGLKAKRELKRGKKR